MLTYRPVSQQKTSLYSPNRYVSKDTKRRATCLQHYTRCAPKLDTSFTPNANFAPPEDFAFLPTLQGVPINCKGPTKIPLKTQQAYTNDGYKYKDFLAYVTLTSEPALTPYEHIDVATRADLEKKAFFAAIPHRKDMTPNIGSEVRGIQLSQLTKKQKDEMALYVAERGVVVFRDQDLVDQGMESLKEFGSYFGRLHMHQWGHHPKSHPDLDISFRDSAKGTYLDDRAEGALNTVAWHTDM